MPDLTGAWGICSILLGLRDAPGGSQLLLNDAFCVRLSSTGASKHHVTP